jgi:hypothetical protein
MRIRAARNHRLYFVDTHHDLDGNTMTLALLIGRIPEPSLFGQVQQ